MAHAGRGTGLFTGMGGIWSPHFPDESDEQSDGFLQFLMIQRKSYTATHMQTFELMLCLSVSEPELEQKQCKRLYHF